MARLLFIGDIVGRPGRVFTMQRVPALRQELRLDAVVANAENAAGGAGCSGSIARELLAHGVDAVTLGDHVWDQHGFDKEIVDLERVCRPANLPVGAPGRRCLEIDCGGLKLGVFTVLGRQFMNPKADCHFLTSDALLERELKGCDAVFAEVHAEATSEKIAYGWYLDGRVMGIAGTHTHVPTADECVLPRGTGYITDVGMTGPYHGVLGREIQPVLGRFLDGLPRKFNVAERDVRLCGAVFDFDERGRCASVERVCVRAPADFSLPSGK